MLKVSDLKKRFGNTEVLKGINLEIGKGEILVVVGSSGGGKTTLLRCVNELEHCDEGNIEVNGKVLCKDGKYVGKKELKEIRKDIGLVFQSFNLFPHMTVLENLIEAPQRVLGWKKEDAIKKAEESLGFLNLLEKKDNYPFELSGGKSKELLLEERWC
jgi:polar amino acid transport system ATP-binding protein